MRRILRALMALALAAVVVISAKFSFWRADIVRQLEAHSTVVQTARGPIEYAEIGDGYPALYLHGTPGGYDQVYFATKLAIERGQPQLLRVIAPSRPGYLRTPLGVGATPQQQAAAFKDLLDVLHVDKVVVFGGSGGGPSALQFALQHPERCTALVLVSAVTQRIADTAPSGLLERFFQTEVGRWLFGGLFLDGLARSNPADTKVRALGEIMLRSTYPYAARDAGRLNDEAQYRRLSNWPLAQVRCPTLIVHGTADRTVPFAHAQFAHEQIAGSRLEAFESGDHFISVSHGTRIDALVYEFVAEHLPDATGG
ncbi:MAG TPA: alpha/beta hydrolase [Steroidobacteraceae bacterium]|nr:alpha/beta hydrolase [Steroidobacteraceae bacterium]